METVLLYRPVSKSELALVEKSDFSEFPPCSPEEPTFYPTLSKKEATKIARGRIAKQTPDKLAYVTKFEVKKDFLVNYEVQIGGGKPHLEYWIPAEDLEEFNRNIVGKIKVISEFKVK